MKWLESLLKEGYVVEVWHGGRKWYAVISYEEQIMSAPGSGSSLKAAVLDAKERHARMQEDRQSGLA
jgi:hypothetical protein